MSSLCIGRSYNAVVLALKGFPPEIRARGMEYIPDDQKTYFEEKLRKCMRCLGCGTERCVFARSQRGGQAQTMGRRVTCLLCTPAELAAECATDAGILKVKVILQEMQPLSRKKAILERVPPAHRHRFSDLLPSEAPPMDAARMALAALRPRPPPAAVAGGEDPPGMGEAAVLRRPAAAEGAGPMQRPAAAAAAAAAPADALPKARAKAGVRRRRADIDEGPLSTAAALARLQEARGAWEEPLARRRRTLAEPSAALAGRFDAGQKRKRQTTRRYMGVEADAREDDVDEDGVGMPPAKRSCRAADLERWAVAGSWAMCSSCHVLQPRDMKPLTFDRAVDPCIGHKQCWRCSAKHQHLSPSLDDVPVALRSLSPAAVAALAPLEVNVGPEIRSHQSNGYRQHAGMIRFAWHETSVIYRLSEVPDGEFRRARQAFRWLLKNNALYKEFVKEHDAFLEKHPEPTEKQRRRWLRTIEREGVECACWPHLFWSRELCFSVERLEDPRRRARRGDGVVSLEERLVGERALDNDDDEEGVDPYGEDEDEGDDTVRHSVRRSFAAKAMGPLTDYGSNYEILHYVFDLTLWSTIGARRNLGLDVPMRVLMSGHPMSPLYWRAVHHALIDQVRQCGYPRLFVTMAPYENSFPYHAFVQDQLIKEQRPRGRLALPETLHMTHVMTELCRGFVAGQNEGTQGREWTRHLLHREDAAGGRVALMTRIEFQDGSRKEATQDYHGSGRPHLHFVVCAEHPEKLRLDAIASASLPEDGDELRGYVLASQLDKKHKTPWPIHDAASSWDSVAETTQLRHSQEDKDFGVRGFFPDIMDATKCHQDVQEATDDGALQAYLVKYPVKFSDAASEDWLNDEHGGDTLAQSVLFRYKPFEPEMVLQLFGARFRQWRCNSRSGGKRDFRVPLPDDAELPDAVRHYEACEWRGADMSLLDFLRRTNAKGEIVRWLRREHQRAVKTGAADADDDLQTFARKYKMFGEQLVAADMLSWRNDRHCGQWLVLHVPFARISDFLDPEVEAKVPTEHRYLALALRCEHEEAKRMWCHEPQLRGELRREGRSKKFVDDVIRQLLADEQLVRGYLSGHLEKSARAAEAVPLPAHAKRFIIQPRYEEEIRAGRKTVEGRIRRGSAADVVAGDVLVLGNTRVTVSGVTHHDGFRAMLEHHGVGKALPGVRSVPSGVRIYHGFRGYQRAAVEHGVVAFEIDVEAARAGGLTFEDLNAQQRRYVTALREGVDHAFAVRDAETDEEAQRLVEATQPKVEVCLGPPGTGKTAATFLVIDEVLERGGRVLFAVYTAQLASRMRERFADHPQKQSMRIETCHAAFALGEDFIAMPTLMEFQLIVVDEVSQLSGEQNDRIIKLWDFADHVPAMAEMGDRWQMAGFGDQRAWETRLWGQATHSTTLLKPYRCKDPAYQKILDMLRTAKPAGAAWGRFQRQFLRKNKAWAGDVPTVADIRKVLLQHPDTTMLAVSRAGATTLNDLAVQAKFPRRAPLATVPGDIESNPANYDVNGRLRAHGRLQPLSLPIYHGMQLYMTRNVRKDTDYINGMRCTVEAWDSVTKAIVVLTATGRRVAITLRSDEDLGGLVYFPVRPGYASTVMKFQGAELSHVVLYLDKKHVPAAAYTAMSRVSFQAQCLIGGRVVADHFAPAR